MIRTTGLLLAGLFALTAAPARADRAGMDLLRKMVAKYRSLNTYSDSWTTTKTQGKNRQTESGDLRLAKPNRFYVSHEVNGRLMTVIAGDGRTIVAYRALAKQYIREPAGAKLPSLLTGINHAPLSLFLGLDLLRQVQDARIVGATTLNGTPVRIVKLTFRIPSPPKDVQLTEKQKADLEKLRRNQPEIRYYIGNADALMYRNEMIARGRTKQSKEATLTVRQDLRNIRVNQPIPATAFAFSPPEGTTRLTPAKPAKR